uniref:ERF1 domain-containing protein n=1 Tax=Panagrolaimus davidi TaxID=227884 RepID=A0A914P0V9_9BILA
MFLMELIGVFFDEISQDSGRYVFGVQDTLQGLDMGAVETLICWENLDITRVKLKKASGEEKVFNLRPDQMADKAHHIDPDTGTEMEMIESLPLLEWLANNYKNFGATLEIVTDRSQEGAQFVRGFGGIGGILRYRVDFQVLEAAEEDDIDLDDY